MAANGTGEIGDDDDIRGAGAALPAEARAIVAEEEALLERVRGALERARKERRPAGPVQSRDALRALRDEAAATSADDLPAVLLELSVRQRLAEQASTGTAAGVLPDPLAPYLAHLRVHEGPAGQRRDYLLGHGTFLEPSAGVRIVDWRVAPVAQIFYRYREGESYEEEFPGRVAEGVVEARRLLVIDKGVLVRIVTDRFVLTRAGDGPWRAEDPAASAFTPGGAGTAARPGVIGLGLGVGEAGRPAAPEVTMMLDAEQYAAVCAPPEQPLLVLGSAGSGKTTVALHRLARIAALGHPLAQMRVVVPEEGLARLARRLLAPLGAGAAQVQTLDAWAVALSREVFEKDSKLCADAPALVSGLKRHPELFHALGQRLAEGAQLGANPGLKRLRRWLLDLFSDRAFLERVVAAAAGSLPRGAVQETVRHTVLQLAEPLDRELASITDPERKVALDSRPIEEGTPDELAGTLDLEDLPILLALRALRGERPGRPISHLVLDEAEDFSLFELLVLGRLIEERRSVTLAGDEAQQTASSFAGWAAGLQTLGVKDAAACRLAVSYRCPRPVAELSQRILGSLAPETPARAARAGAPVGLFTFPGPTEAPAQLFIAGALRDLLEREPRAAVAVIARDAAAARRFYERVADLSESRLVLRGEFSFEPGLDVTDVDNCKGLEFDYVVVPDATAQAYPATDEARRRLHVAVTRASHQLWVVSGGPPSPLLGQERGRT